jgi:hypothetical protein
MPPLSRNLTSGAEARNCTRFEAGPLERGQIASRKSDDRLEEGLQTILGFSGDALIIC